MNTNMGNSASVTKPGMDPELKARLLASMKLASEVLSDYEREENWVRSLTPQPESADFRRSLSARMSVTFASHCQRYNSSQLYWKKYAAVAATLTLCFSFAAYFYLQNGNSYANEHLQDSAETELQLRKDTEPESGLSE